MKKKEIKLLMRLMASGMSSDVVPIYRSEIKTLKKIIDAEPPGIIIRRAELKTSVEGVLMVSNFEYIIKPEIWFEWMKLKTNQ